jgi:hypothetical protein
LSWPVRGGTPRAENFPQATASENFLDGCAAAVQLNFIHAKTTALGDDTA